MLYARGAAAAHVHLLSFQWLSLFLCGCSFLSRSKNTELKIPDSASVEGFGEDSGDTDIQLDTSADSGLEGDTSLEEDVLPPNCIEERYTGLYVDEWKVCIESTLLTTDVGDLVINLLHHDLNVIKTKLHPAVFEKLQTVRIWVEENGDWSGAVYHPSTSWLRDNGYPEHWAESIQIANAANYLSWTSVQPAMVLHELSHAWHHQYIGYDHPGVLEAYEAAMESGIYDSVPYAGGGNAEAYAKTNALEYFAELSEAWFWENDFYPFTREELLEFDPVGASVVEAVWSTN